MYIEHIKQDTQNDYAPGDDPLYLRPYRSVTGTFLKKYQRVIEIDRLSSPPIARYY